MRTVSIGDLAHPKQWRSLAKSEMVEQGYPVYGANGVIGYASEFTHREPTLLIGCRGTIGAVHISEPRAFVTGNAMALDSLDSSRVNIAFLARFLAWRGLTDVTSGSSQPQLTRQNLVGVKVPLPHLQEQRRIAAILDHADALRANRRHVLAHLDTLAQSIFVALFEHQSWPKSPLAAVVDTATSVTYGIVQAGPEFPGGTPYIRTGDIVAGDIVVSGLRHTDPKIAARFERSTVRAGDIVMSIRATVGTTALVPAEADGANLTQGTARIAPSKLALGPYLLACLRSDSVQHWIERQIKGATFREITLGRLRQLEVPLPPVAMQEDFATRITKIDGYRRATLGALVKSDELFASLQSRAFRGER